MKPARRSRFPSSLLTKFSLLIALLCILYAGRFFATERLQRQFGPDTGLIVYTVFNLAQDTEGFIWIGSGGGLVRYDGDQMRPWAKDRINRDVSTLSVSKVGAIAAEGSGTLHQVTANGVEFVADRRTA